jgi:hypothetical protein
MKNGEKLFAEIFVIKMAFYVFINDSSWDNFLHPISFQQQ